MYFGRKELFAIFILRILIKLNVLAIMFDMQRAYSTRAILFGGRTDVIGFKILAIAISMLINKLIGSVVKFLFGKYVKAKHEKKGRLLSCNIQL